MGALLRGTTNVQVMDDSFGSSFHSSISDAARSASAQIVKKLRAGAHKQGKTVRCKTTGSSVVCKVTERVPKSSRRSTGKRTGRAKSVSRSMSECDLSCKSSSRSASQSRSTSRSRSGTRRKSASRSTPRGAKSARSTVFYYHKRSGQHGKIYSETIAHRGKNDNISLVAAGSIIGKKHGYPGLVISLNRDFSPSYTMHKRTLRAVRKATGHEYTTTRYVLSPNK